MSKNKKLEGFIREIEKIADAFDMTTDDFGQRAMRTSVLSTGYASTKDAIDFRRVSYRRTLNMKVGIAVADVFEISDSNVLQFDEFISRVSRAYMILCGIPFIERENRRSEVKAVIEKYLERLIALGLVSIFHQKNQKFVKMEPELGSSAYAMIINPESLLRGPYIKAISQTIGAMSIVDKKQNNWTIKEISDYVQDSMVTKGIVKNYKPTYLFSAQNIEPFHVSKNVQFYSQQEDKLIILPTFPRPGTIKQLDSIDTPLIDKELAYEILESDGINRFTSGVNPPLIPIATGDSTLYFHRNDVFINAFKEHFEVPLSKFIPKQGIALRALSALQSKLGSRDYDGPKVASIIQKIFEGGMKEGKYDSYLEKEVATVLFARLGFIEPDKDGVFRPINKALKHLKYLRGLCDIKNPVTSPIAKIVTSEG
jgi:hypothetical protein